MSTTRRRARTGAVAALVLALGASGCTGDDQDDQQPAGGPEGGDVTALETTVTLGQVLGGKLAAARRDRVKEDVKAVVDRWVDAAYVGGEWPRRDFADAFPGFTPGAAAEARRDRALLTNADIGERVESVTATRRRLQLDVLVVRGRPVGVTAHVGVAFRTTGEVARTETVKGRLFLTPAGERWKVFGYDVTAGGRSAASGQQRDEETSR